MSAVLLFTGGLGFSHKIRTAKPDEERINPKGSEAVEGFFLVGLMIDGAAIPSAHTTQVLTCKRET